MNMVMLDCDHATYLVTRKEYDKLPCMKRMQLKMHLATCKLCRTFSKQSKIISDQIDAIKEADSVNYDLHLSPPQKKHLQEAIEVNLKND